MVGESLFLYFQESKPYEALGEQPWDAALNAGRP